MQKGLKKIGAVAVAVSMFVSAVAPALLIVALPSIASAVAGNYVISGTGVVTGYTVNLSGYASSTPYVGNLNDQHISIDWDEDGDGIPNTWLTEDSDSSGNDAGVTADIVFDIDSYGTGSDKYFVDNDWTATHTYSTGGAKKIFVRVHHATPTGAEGSDFGTIEINVIIIPPEDTLGTCSDTIDNDTDGLIDLADPGCADFIPTLTVTKVVTNDNGGTAVSGDFPLFIDGFSVSSGVASTTSAGLHTVSETSNADYAAVISGDCAANGTITLAIGGSATCTITNNDTPPSLTLIKQVVNAFGGTALASAWNLLAQGATSTVSGTSGVTSNATFQAGSYSLSESGGPANYDLSIICDVNGATSSVSILSLLIGDVSTCTFTNTQQEPGTLTVKKVVLNNNPEGFEGTSTADDFQFQIDGGSAITFIENGLNPLLGENVITLDPGTYNIAEVAPSSYGVSYDNCSSIVITPGGSATCTITNDDNSPTQAYLTMTKVVINDNGGTAVSGDWTLLASSTPLSSGVATLMNPGVYDIGESSGPVGGGYNLASIMCSTNGGATVTTTSLELVAGSSYVCTITNDDIAPSLSLQKVVDTDLNGGDAVATDWTLFAVGATSSLQGAGSASSGSSFQAGTYTLSEDLTSEDGPTGYTASSWSCSGDAENVDNTITLGIGDEVTCTITNESQPGTLVVVKEIINDDGGTATADDFSFQIDDDDPIQFDADGQNETSLPAGTYAVSELEAVGYGISYSDNCGSIIITNGATSTCTITNNDGEGTLILVKHTIGADGTFDITVSGQEGTTTLSTVDGSATTTLSLDAGAYAVSEGEVDGWTQSGLTCSNEEDPAEILLTSGETVTCTFTNTATGADLSIAKTVDDTTPDAGQTITYTLTASNAGPAAANNVVVSDVLPAGLTFVSTSTSDTVGIYATSTGQWTIGTLASGSSTTLHITATVSGTAGQTIINSASIFIDDEETSVSDYNENNDSGTSSVTVNTPGTPTPTPTPGGGNGPVVGSFGVVLGASTGPVAQVGQGQVLGESCGLYLNKHLRRGSTKNDREQTIRLQNFLNKWMISNLPITGYFGPLTEAAVRAFQAKYADDVLAPWGLTKPTGLVYLSTIRKMNLIECTALDIQLPPLIPWSQNPNAQ